jgi:hypothetical protein
MCTTEELLKLAIQLNGKTIAGAQFEISNGTMYLLLHFTDGSSYKVAPGLSGPQMDQHLIISIHKL